MSTPTVIINLVKRVGIRRLPGQKPQQPWSFSVQDAANHKHFERSSERYLEDRKAISAIEQVHGPDATVVLRRKGHPDRILRQPASRRVELTEDEMRKVIDVIWGGGTPHPDFEHTVTRVIGGINAVVAP